MESGKFVLRIDPKLHKSLKTKAKLSGESLNSYCIQKLHDLNHPQNNEVLLKIIEHFSPLGVILFGSVARNEARDTSDIDLLIVLPDSQKIERSLYQQWDTIDMTTIKYSPQFTHLPKDENNYSSLWLEVSIDGDILFDSNSLLKLTLQKIRKKIAEGSYLRKISHGQGYWVRKDEHAK